MTDTVTITTERFAVEEFQKLARSRKRAFSDLAHSPLPGQRRHAAKREAEALAWSLVVDQCNAALAPKTADTITATPAQLAAATLTGHTA